MSVPVFKGSWWVLPGGLLAGPAPVEPDRTTNLENISNYGVRGFIDLREPDEVFSGCPAPQYLKDLPSGAIYKNFPIRDGYVPASIYDLDRIVLAVEELVTERMTYIHCHGGHGRTGLVVGCWLIFRGMSGVEALREIHRLRLEAWDRLARIQSPQTSDQIEMLLEYEVFLKKEGRFVGDSYKLFEEWETA